MTAAIVTIGDEILIGQIVDTNSGYIAKALNDIGVDVLEMYSIADQEKAILSTLNSLQNKVNFVIITGGLGPTKDDITKKTFCAYFDDVLVTNETVLKHVTQLIEKFYKRPISQINKDQALLPSKCIVLENKIGTAAGMWMQKEDTYFIALPGVPYEMQHLIKEQVIPKIESEFLHDFIVHKTIMTYGVGESLLAETIEKWEDNLPSYVKLAYLPSPGRVRLRLTAKGKNKELLESIIERETQELKLILGDVITGFDNEAIDLTVSNLLKNNHLTISVAESFTGGALSQKFTQHAGASQLFKGGIVSYTTESKIEILGVDANIIKKNGVVSTSVAEAMALQAKKIFKSDYSIATTGNAGPTQGDEKVAVGTICIAWATPNGIFSEQYDMGQPREKVVERAINKALEVIRKEILKNN
ncbi:MAG: CinA family nicotinamide mononucleotide deamidase-related protein [Flavobacterium sp.]